MKKLIDIATNCAYTQAANCFACLHIGSVAIYFLPRNGWYTSHRLEIFTERRRFRFSRGFKTHEACLQWRQARRQRAA